MTAFLTGLLLFAALLVPATASAEDTAKEDEQILPVKWVTSLVKPWGLWTENGDSAGLLVEFKHLLEAEIQIPMENQMRPYSRVIHEIRTGTADVAVLFVSPESELIAESLGKISDVRILLVGAPGSSAISDFSELEGKRVGHIRGSRYGQAFDENTKINHIAINTMKQALSMLVRGRIDYMASSEQTLYFTLEQMGLDIEKVSVMGVVGYTRVDLYQSRQSSGGPWVEEIRAGLKRLRQAGELEKIFYPRGKDWADLPLIGGGD